MKKKSFLSGIGAKLALAAVALTTMVFTSCEKEEFNVEPFELSPASATILATVYDQTTGENLGTQTTTINADENGTIAKHKVTVNCPFSHADYLPAAPIEVEVPSVAKGQTILVPVIFYAQKIAAAAQNVTTSKDETTIVPSTKPNKQSKEYVGTGMPQDVEYEAWVGTEVLNLEDINAYIETLVKSRAMSQDNVIIVLKALVKTYDNMTTQTIQAKMSAPKGATFVINPVTAMTEYVVSIKATVDGVEYIIPNVKIKEAGNTTAEQNILSHNHGGHDNHGNSSNAGGGAAGR